MTRAWAYVDAKGRTWSVVRSDRVFEAGRLARETVDGQRDVLVEHIAHAGTIPDLCRELDEAS